MGWAKTTFLGYSNWSASTWRSYDEEHSMMSDGSVDPTSPNPTDSCSRDAHGEPDALSQSINHSSLIPWSSVGVRDVVSSAASPRLSEVPRSPVVSPLCPRQADALVLACCRLELMGISSVRLAPAISWRSALNAFRCGVVRLDEDEQLLALVVQRRRFRDRVLDRPLLAVTNRGLQAACPPSTRTKHRNHTVRGPVRIPFHDLWSLNDSATSAASWSRTPRRILAHLPQEARDGLLRLGRRLRLEGAGAESIEQALDDLKAAAHLSDRLRAYQNQLHLFACALRQRTPHVIITYLILLLCVMVFGVMTISGVSPLHPDPEDLIAWGCLYGPRVALFDESWRALTMMFLHVGILHLAMNAWCLWVVGPLIERMFGHGSFLAIYLIAGLGGATASLAWHPINLSAGASGAVFGLIGALGAASLHRPQSIPPLVARTLSRAVWGFVALNLAIGLSLPMIDNAAHLGGLVCGFLAGAILFPKGTLLNAAPSASTPTETPADAGESPSGGIPSRRVVFWNVMRPLGALALAAFVLQSWRLAVHHAWEDPHTRLIGFLEQVEPLERDINHVIRRYNQLSERIVRQKNRHRGDLGTLDIQMWQDHRRLLEEVESIQAQTRKLQAPGPELAATAAELDEAVARLAEALKWMRESIRAETLSTLVNSSLQWKRAQREFQELNQRYQESVRAYAQTHAIRLNPR